MVGDLNSKRMSENGGSSGSGGKKTDTLSKQKSSKRDLAGSKQRQSTNAKTKSDVKKSGGKNPPSQGKPSADGQSIPSSVDGGSSSSGSSGSSSNSDGAD